MMISPTVHNSQSLNFNILSCASQQKGITLKGDSFHHQGIKLSRLWHDVKSNPSQLTVPTTLISLAAKVPWKDITI